MGREEMRQLLLDNDDKSYDDIMVEFEFNGYLYDAQLTFAYLNSNFNEIFKKHEVTDYDELMLVDKMTASNYKKYMNKVVRFLYEREYKLEIADEILFEMLNIFNEIIDLFDHGKKRVSLDISLISIALAMDKDERIRELLFTKHANGDMIPEEIAQVKKDVLKRIRELEIPGLSTLLRGESGIRADQLLNVICGLYLRVKANGDLNEIYPFFIEDRWLDGLSTPNALYIEHSIQRIASILNNQTMKSSGAHNKKASILAQDMEITEEDCGSINYVEYNIEDEVDLKSVEFKYRLEGDQLVETTRDDKHLIGTTIKVRDPYKCACKNGVCATCFGSHAKWNLSTDKRRLDVGFLSARAVNSSRSQKILSVKHSSTPVLIPSQWTVVNVLTGEMVEFDGMNKDNQFFSRRWNWVYFKDECTNLRFDVADVVLKENQKRAKLRPDDNPTAYLDGEFGDKDIIRVSKIYFDYNGEMYYIENNTPFRIHKMDYATTKSWVITDTIKITHNTPVSYVIKNTESVTDFRKISGVYDNYSTESLEKELHKANPGINVKDLWEHQHQIENMYNKIKEVVKGDNITMVSCALRNKIIAPPKSGERVPDWTAENPDYVIYNCLKAINRKPSVTSILPIGFTYKRLHDPAFHDIRNLEYSVFDGLFKLDDNKG